MVHWMVEATVLPLQQNLLEIGPLKLARNPVQGAGGKGSWRGVSLLQHCPKGVSGEAASHCRSQELQTEEAQPALQELAIGAAVHNCSNLMLQEQLPGLLRWDAGQRAHITHGGQEETHALQEPEAGEDFCVKGTRCWQGCLRILLREHAEVRKENLLVFSVSPVPSTGMAQHHASRERKII